MPGTMRVSNVVEQDGSRRLILDCDEDSFDHGGMVITKYTDGSVGIFADGGYISGGHAFWIDADNAPEALMAIQNWIEQLGGTNET